MSKSAAANYYENPNLNITNSNIITAKPVVIVHDRIQNLFLTTGFQLQVYTGPYGKPATSETIIFAPASAILSNVQVAVERGVVAAIVETADNGPLFLQRFQENRNGIEAINTWIKASPAGASLSQVLVSNASIFVFYRDGNDDCLYMAKLPVGQNSFLNPVNISNSGIVSFSVDTAFNGNILIGFTDTANNGIVKTVDAFSLEITESVTFSQDAKDFITVTATILESINIVTFRDQFNTPCVATIKNGQTLQLKPLTQTAGSAAGYASGSTNRAAKGGMGYYTDGSFASVTRFSVDIHGTITIPTTEVVTDFAPTHGLTLFMDRVGNLLLNLLDGSAHPRIYTGLHDASFSLLATSTFTANTTHAPYIFNFDPILNRGILPFIDSDTKTVQPSVVTTYNQDYQMLKQQQLHSLIR